MPIVVNKSPIDQFTVIHAGAGVLAHRLGFSFWQTLGAGIVWDYAMEPELKKTYPEAFPYPSPDAPAHKLIDAVTPAIAWWVTDWYARRSS